MFIWKAIAIPTVSLYFSVKNTLFMFVIPWPWDGGQTLTLAQIDISYGSAALFYEIMLVTVKTLFDFIYVFI